MFRNILSDLFGERKDRGLSQSLGQSSFWRAASVVVPVFVYDLTIYFVWFLFFCIVQWMSGKTGILFLIYLWTQEHSLLFSSLIRSLAILSGALLLLPSFLKETPVFVMPKKSGADIFLICILGASAALFFNVLFSGLRITQMSGAYTQVGKAQFSLPLWGGMIIYGALSPIAEELVFRGIVYNRFKRQFPFGLSYFGSALLFGVFHGNLVQALYGFILALIILWIYEKYGSFWMPVLLHASANIAVYTVMKIDFLKTEMMSILGCMISGAVMIITICFICKKKIKDF